LFATLCCLGNSADEIVQVALRHLSEEETERLTVWIANRAGRAQALAGDRGAYGRLDHVTRHWLSEGQRSALLGWLMRRIALGQPPVPEAPVRRERPPPGTGVGHSSASSMKGTSGGSKRALTAPAA